MHAKCQLQFEIVCEKCLLIYCIDIDHENFIPRNILSIQWYELWAWPTVCALKTIASALRVECSLFCLLLFCLFWARPLPYPTGYPEWCRRAIFEYACPSYPGQHIIYMDRSLAVWHAVRLQGKVCSMMASHTSCWHGILEPLSRTQHHCLYQHCAAWADS